MLLLASEMHTFKPCSSTLVFRGPTGRKEATLFSVKGKLSAAFVIKVYFGINLI